MYKSNKERKARARTIAKIKRGEPPRRCHGKQSLPQRSSRDIQRAIRIEDLDLEEDTAQKPRDTNRASFLRRWHIRIYVTGCIDRLPGGAAASALRARNERGASAQRARCERAPYIYIYYSCV